MEKPEAPTGTPGAPARAEPAGPGGEEGLSGTPAVLLRLGTMIRTMLQEARHLSLDEEGRRRLKDIHDRSVQALKQNLSDPLREEFEAVAPPLTSDVPTEAELRMAQAQVIGWLEGLFHGIQAALWAQNLQVQSQLEELRRNALPPGQEDRRGPYL